MASEERMGEHLFEGRTLFRDGREHELDDVFGLVADVRFWGKGVVATGDATVG